MKKENFNLNFNVNIKKYNDNALEFFKFYSTSMQKKYGVI